MAYHYEDERHKLFTEDGEETLLKVRDLVTQLLKTAGDFKEENVVGKLNGEAWTQLAALDYMIERGEIRRVALDKIMVYVKY